MPAEASSPANDCWVSRRRAANAANNNGESPGVSGTSPSADGANPTADNNIDANGAFTGFGTAAGASSNDAVVGTGATSTADTSRTAGAADTGSDLRCTSVVVSATAWLLLTPPRDGVNTTDRFGVFGVFGVFAAADKSVRDFLSLTVDAVDFLLSPLADSPPLAAPSPAFTVDPASSPPDTTDDDSAVSGADADGESDEVDDPESDGPAHATPGVVATATPTPKVTANPPTRPTYLA